MFDNSNMLTLVSDCVEEILSHSGHVGRLMFSYTNRSFQSYRPKKIATDKFLFRILETDSLTLCHYYDTPHMKPVWEYIFDRPYVSAFIGKYLGLECIDWILKHDLFNVSVHLILEFALPSRKKTVIERIIKDVDGMLLEQVQRIEFSLLYRNDRCEPEERLYMHNQSPSRINSNPSLSSAKVFLTAGEWYSRHFGHINYLAGGDLITDQIRHALTFGHSVSWIDVKNHSSLKEHEHWHRLMRVAANMGHQEAIITLLSLGVPPPLPGSYAMLGESVTEMVWNAANLRGEIINLIKTRSDYDELLNRSRIEEIKDLPFLSDEERISTEYLVLCNVQVGVSTLTQLYGPIMKWLMERYRYNRLGDLLSSYFNELKTCYPYKLFFDHDVQQVIKVLRKIISSVQIWQKIHSAIISLFDFSYKRNNHARWPLVNHIIKIFSAIPQLREEVIKQKESLLSQKYLPYPFRVAIIWIIS